MKNAGEVRERKHQLIDYMERTQDLMADYDWSRFASLQEVTEGEIKAAALLLWGLGERTPDVHGMCRVLLRRAAHCPDEGALCASDSKVRDLIDQACDLRVSGHLIDTLHRELSRVTMARIRDHGDQVVELTTRLEFPVSSQEEGYYIFRGEGTQE